MTEPLSHELATGSITYDPEMRRRASSYAKGMSSKGIAFSNYRFKSFCLRILAAFGFSEGSDAYVLKNHIKAIAVKTNFTPAQLKAGRPKKWEEVVSSANTAATNILGTLKTGKTEANAVIVLKKSQIAAEHRVRIGQLLTALQRHILPENFSDEDSNAATKLNATMKYDTDLTSFTPAALMLTLQQQIRSLSLFDIKDINKTPEELLSKLTDADKAILRKVCEFLSKTGLTSREAGALLGPYLATTSTVTTKAAEQTERLIQLAQRLIAYHNTIFEPAPVAITARAVVARTDAQIADCLAKLVQFLPTTNMPEGLFRTTGDASEVRQLYQDLTPDTDVVPRDPAILTDVFKRLVKDLNLFTDKAPPAIPPLQPLIDSLDAVKKAALKQVCTYLHLVSNSTTAKMPASNLGLMLGPNLGFTEPSDLSQLQAHMIQCNDIATALIAHPDIYFGAS